MNAEESATNAATADVFSRLEWPRPLRSRALENLVTQLHHHGLQLPRGWYGPECRHAMKLGRNYYRHRGMMPLTLLYKPHRIFQRKANGSSHGVARVRSLAVIDYIGLFQRNGLFLACFSTAAHGRRRTPIAAVFPHSFLGRGRFLAMAMPITLMIVAAAIWLRQELSIRDFHSAGWYNGIIILSRKPIKIFGGYCRRHARRCHGRSANWALHRQHRRFRESMRYRVYFERRWLRYGDALRWLLSDTHCQMPHAASPHAKFH